VYRLHGFSGSWPIVQINSRDLVVFAGLLTIRPLKESTMLYKKWICVALLASTTAAISTSAMAYDDGANTAIGAVAGAVIGGAVGGRNGAIVGGVLGAAVGATSGGYRQDDRGYYDRGQGYYAQPEPVYYRPQPVYYRPAPVYYQPQPVYYRPAPVYVESRDYYRQPYRGGYYER